MENIKKDYDYLNKLLDNHSSIINIIFVIYGIRQSYWYDIWDLDKSKLNKLLNFIKKKENIKYKFDDGNKYIKGKYVVEEGPLIYNTKKLNKKLLKIIENNDLKIIYDLPIFGEILGYSCAEDIYSIDIKKSISIFIDLYEGDNFICNIYGFICHNKFINDELFKLIKKMNIFIKKLNKNFIIVYNLEK